MVLAWMTGFLLLNGVLAVIAGLGWGVRQVAVEGLLDLGFAGLLAVWYGVIPVTLVAVWALATGLVQLWTSLTVHGLVPGEWPLALGGVASIVLCAFLLFNPGVGRGEFWSLVGVFAVVWGELTLIMAWGLTRRAPTS
jgi:uncharacterized membrane protein HdeD (DUF308 family)